MTSITISRLTQTTLLGVFFSLNSACVFDRPIRWIGNLFVRDSLGSRALGLLVFLVSSSLDELRSTKSKKKTYCLIECSLWSIKQKIEEKREEGKEKEKKENEAMLKGFILAWFLHQLLMILFLLFPCCLRLVRDGNPGSNERESKKRRSRKNGREERREETYVGRWQWFPVSCLIDFPFALCRHRR